MDNKEQDTIELENGVKYVWWKVYHGMDNIITRQDNPEAEIKFVHSGNDCCNFWTALNYAFSERSFRK